MQSGGWVYNENTFEMSGGEISNNAASYEGGGIYNWGGATRIEYNFKGNTKEIAGYHPSEAVLRYWMA
ncbi:MAG: hypothetical protein LBE76_07970 [Nitrososphaerota archaeon]|jgi:hypothetical protein|nr:hypothetical protein [Nitrososphaerota archaeon]